MGSLGASGGGPSGGGGTGVTSGGGGGGESALARRLREERERRAARSRTAADEKRRATQARMDEARTYRESETRRKSRQAEEDARERQRSSAAAAESQKRMAQMQQMMQPLAGPAGGAGGAPAGPPLGSPGAITGGGIQGFQGGGGMQSTVGADPEIQKYRDEIGSQLEELKQPSDPSRERGMSATRIAGAQAGQEAQLEEEMAGRGLDTKSGIGGELARRSREGAQTDAAMAGAGIDMEAESERKKRLDSLLQFGAATSGMGGEAARAGQGVNIAGYQAQTGRRAQDVTMRGQDINSRLGQMGMWANLLNA